MTVAAWLRGVLLPAALLLAGGAARAESAEPAKPADPAKPAAEAGGHPGARTHPWPGGQLVVSVPADEPAVAGTVDVVLLEGELPVARLSARRPGALTESHLTDLDRDRLQELLLVYADASGSPTQVEAWEWQAKRHAFVRFALPPIEAGVPLAEGRFRLDGDTLTFSARAAGGKGDPMTWNYDAEDARWERRRRYWPW